MDRVSIMFSYLINTILCCGTRTDKSGVKEEEKVITPETEAKAKAKAKAKEKRKKKRKKKKLEDNPQEASDNLTVDNINRFASLKPVNKSIEIEKQNASKSNSDEEETKADPPIKQSSSFLDQILPKFSMKDSLGVNNGNATNLQTEANKSIIENADHEDSEDNEDKKDNVDLDDITVEKELFELNYNHINEFENLSSRAIEELGEVLQRSIVLKPQEFAKDDEEIDLIITCYKVSKLSNTPVILLISTIAVYILNSQKLSSVIIRLGLEKLYGLFVDFKYSRIVFKSNDELNFKSIFIEHPDAKYIAASVTSMQLELRALVMPVHYISKDDQFEILRVSNIEEFIRNAKNTEYDKFRAFLSKYGDGNPENFVYSWSVNYMESRGTIEVQMVLSNRNLNFFSATGKKGRFKVKRISALRLEIIDAIYVLFDSSAVLFKAGGSNDELVIYNRSREMGRQVGDIIYSIYLRKLDIIGVNTMKELRKIYKSKKPVNLGY